MRKPLQYSTLSVCTFDTFDMTNKLLEGNLMYLFEYVFYFFWRCEILWIINQRPYVKGVKGVKDVKYYE